VILISQLQIIHNIFGLKTAAVNKFYLLSFGKIRSTEIFAAKRRMRIARRFNGGKANQKMRVPTGRKKIFSIFALVFLPPLRGLEILRLNPAVKTAGYFQIVPFGTKSRSTEKFLRRRILSDYARTKIHRYELPLQFTTRFFRTKHKRIYFKL
jgi:hypothetical protein